jgi:WD40 repeat protein
LAGGGDNGNVYLWDAQGSLLRWLAGHQRGVKSLAWSSDGTRLASSAGGVAGGELFVWDARSGERLFTFDELPEMIYSAAWGKDERWLISGGGDGVLQWWDLERKQCVFVREAHRGTIQSLRRSPDGKQLASCGDDGAIRLWDLEHGRPLQTLRRDRPYERLDITGIQGLTEAQRESLRGLGAFEQRSLL